MSQSVYLDFREQGEVYVVHSSAIKVFSTPTLFEFSRIYIPGEAALASLEAPHGGWFAGSFLSTETALPFEPFSSAARLVGAIESQVAKRGDPGMTSISQASVPPGFRRNRRRELEELL